MKLHEIIAHTDNQEAILYDCLQPYLKSLHTYFKDEFGCEPLALAVSVTNACQYILIVPENEAHEALLHYFSDEELEYQLSDEELENAIETTFAQSFTFSQLLN